MLDHRLRRWSIIKQTSGLIMIPGAENFYILCMSHFYAIHNLGTGRIFLQHSLI